MNLIGPNGKLDLNFYPERHMDVLKGLSDIEVPPGWTLGKLIEELTWADAMLWAVFWRVDDDGNIVRRQP